MLLPENLTLALGQRQSRIGVVLDFDGVLAPIVSDPAESRMVQGAEETLRHLVRSVQAVAVLSGRPVSFLRSRVQVAGIVLLGSYGVERLEGEQIRASPALDHWLPIVAGAVQHLQGLLQDQDGVVIEEKGTSVAVHWRQATHAVGAATSVADATRQVAALTGLHREPGRLVEELRAPLWIDKGTALTELVDEYCLDHVVYIGDDRGDLPALRVASARGGTPVVVMSDEVHTDLTHVGGVQLSSQQMVLPFLHQIVRSRAAAGLN